MNVVDLHPNWKQKLALGCPPSRLNFFFGSCLQSVVAPRVARFPFSSHQGNPTREWRAQWRGSNLFAFRVLLRFWRMCDHANGMHHPVHLDGTVAQSWVVHLVAVLRRRVPFNWTETQVFGMVTFVCAFYVSKPLTSLLNCNGIQKSLFFAQIQVFFDNCGNDFACCLVTYAWRGVNCMWSFVGKKLSVSFRCTSSVAQKSNKMYPIYHEPMCFFLFNFCSSVQDLFISTNPNPKHIFLGQKFLGDSKSGYTRLSWNLRADAIFNPTSKENGHNYQTLKENFGLSNFGTPCGPLTPKTNWHSSWFEWTKCHTFQNLFPCNCECRSSSMQMNSNHIVWQFAAEFWLVVTHI